MRLTSAASVARFACGNRGGQTAGAALTAPLLSISSTAAVQSGTPSKREEFVLTADISGNGLHVWLVVGGRYTTTGMLSTKNSCAGY